VLRAQAPRSLDEGVAALRADRSPGWGVYRGRLGSSEQLMSPGGVVCVFYEAELRGAMPDGSKGPLLSVERGYAPLVLVRGERVEVVVGFSPQQLLAPVGIRRCGPGVGPGVLVEGRRPEEAALSYERVGKPGEECLVVGELRRGRVEGAYELRGRQGGPALVILGAERAGTGAVLARQAWGLFMLAGALVVLAAWMLSG
jgi:hypothetical protein